MRIKYLFLSLIFVGGIGTVKAQLEKELLLTFKQGENELDAAAKNNLEKSLQAFAPNSPIQVLFYQEVSSLENGQFNNIQADKKNQAVINFLKSRNVKIKYVRTEGIENDGMNNPNSLAILLSGTPETPPVMYASIENPKNGNGASLILPQPEKLVPSAGEEFFPSETDTVTFERAAELFLSPFRKDKKVRPMYH